MRNFCILIALFCSVQLFAQLPAQKQPVMYCTLDTTGHAGFCVQNNKAGALVVECSLWGRWVKFDTLCTVTAGQDTCVQVDYQLHYGLNQIRFFIDDGNRSTYDVTSSSAKCTVKDSTYACGNLPEQKSAGSVQLLRPTYWELYNGNGTFVRRGRSAVIDKNGLSAGTYQLNYENCSLEFIVK